MKYCDNCQVTLLDSERICPSCLSDSGINQRHVLGQIMDFVSKYRHYPEEELLHAILERWNLSMEEGRDIIDSI